MKKHGKQSIKFDTWVNIASTASVVGPKEGEGPLGKFFDIVLDDMLCGTSSWEQAESEITRQGLELAIKKAGLQKEDIEYLLSGDLLNQTTGTTFGIRDLNIPFFGLFGACSTMGEAMSLGAMLIDGGFADNALVGASSHHSAAEKQFRFPLNLGAQRPPTASWTVTGQGCAVLTKEGYGPYITAVTTGKVVDAGVTDANNMGAAMAPAAASTLVAHFAELNRMPDYYDVIATGDLGHIGRDLLIELMRKEGYDIRKNYVDCGVEIFNREAQDTHAGGSGCGCSAVSFAGYFYDSLKNKKINKLLFVPTGALMSPLSVQQGESIPGIAHAVAVENGS